MLSESELCGRFSKMDSPSANGSTVPPGLGSSEVRTLFVSGLPMDVRLRELYLLFRGYEGYEGSLLKLISSKPGKPPQPIAFVSFKTRKHAEKALEELQGIRFDPASSQTLRLEFAHTNSRVSPRQPQTLPPNFNYSQEYVSHKNGTYAYYVLPNTALTHQTARGVVGVPPDSWPAKFPMYHAMSPHSSAGSSHHHFSTLGFLSDSDPSYSVQPQMYYGVLPTPSPTPSTTPAHPPPPGPNTVPCSTLFVANLELHHTEEEISNIFSSCRGFVKAKMFSRGGPPVAFVEFEDVDCAKNAMEKLQSYVLVTSKRHSGIRIEYAKQRMGESLQNGYSTHQAPSPTHSVGSTASSPSSSTTYTPPPAQHTSIISAHNGGFNTPMSLFCSNGYSSQGQLYMNTYSSPVFTSWPVKPTDMQSV